MFSRLNPAAAGFGALLMAFAFAGVTQVVAQAAPDGGAGGNGGTYSTTCGAGTLEKCGETPVIKCEWEFHMSFNPITKGFELSAGQTNCKTAGSLPVYKNRDNLSIYSKSCDLLAPFLGMPAGTSCSDE